MAFVNGATVRVWGHFKDTNDSFQDPTTVIAKIRTPRGELLRYVYGTDAEVVKSATGKYYVDVTATDGGRWHARWESIGTIDTAGEGGFEVRDNDF